MLEPQVAIAVAEGQNYPPALDPTKVELSEKVRSLPAFDPSGTLSGLNFFDPAYWKRSRATPPPGAGSPAIPRGALINRTKARGKHRGGQCGGQT